VLALGESVDRPKTDSPAVAVMAGCESRNRQACWVPGWEGLEFIQEGGGGFWGGGWLG
jgi:hypothetical protein